MKTKTILLFVGLLGTYAALQTGEEAADSVRKSEVLELHEEFAENTFTVFCILAGIYVIWWLDKQGYTLPGLKQATKIVHILFKYRIVALLALLGLILLTGTGALGGAMVHGPDPIAQFILDMLGE